MVSPLSGPLASLIYTGMKALFIDATLTRDVATPGSPDAPFDPPAPTTVDYSCKAIAEKRNTKFDKGGVVLSGNYRVIILANSLSVDPLPNDRITISGVTFTICDGGVVTDPARACWTCVGQL